MIPSILGAALALVIFYLFRRLSDCSGIPGELEPSPMLLMAPWFALGLGLVLTLIAWGWERRQFQHDDHLKFNEIVTRIDSAIRERVRATEGLLDGAKGFFELGKATYASWENYVQPSHLEQHFPWVYGLGYAGYVPGEQWRHFLSTARKENDSFRLSPPGTRFEYFVLQFLQPLNRNSRALGFDLATDLNARSAAERARDTGQASLSGRLVLPDDPEHINALYLLPVYAADQPHEASDARKAAIRGWVVARFRPEEVFKNLPVPLMTLAAIQVFDGPALSAESMVFTSHDSKGEKSLHLSQSLVLPLSIGGRIWTVRYTPKTGFEGVSGASKAASAAAVGGILSLLAFCVVWGLVASRRNVYRLARLMTKDSHQREKALASGPNGIVIADAMQPEHPITFVNSRFEKLTGYSSAEVLGKNCRLLQGTDHDQKNLKEVKRALKEQRECHVLLRNYKKDGTPFWNDLTLSPIKNDVGRVVEFVGMVQDVTEREQQQRRLVTQMAILRTLAESSSMSAAATGILQALCEGQDWDLGVFWRLDPRSKVLRFFEVWRAQDIDSSEFESFSRETTYPKDMGLPGHVWSRGEPFVLTDLSADGKFPEASLLARQGLVSACGFPIANRRGLQGVLVFYARKIWPLSKNLLLLMVGTSAQLSHYIERQEAADHAEDVSILEKGLADFMGEGLLAMDREGTCIFVNAAATRLLGYSSQHLLGQPLHEVLHSSQILEHPCTPDTCPIVLSLQSTEPSYFDEDQYVCRSDRSALPVAYTTSPIIKEELLQGVVVTFNDVSARRGRQAKEQRALEESQKEVAALKASLEKRPASLPSHAVGMNGGGKPTILLVEEDEALREKTRLMLEAKGLKVYTASDGAQALALSEKHPGTVTLLITDVFLSQMTGKALAHKLLPSQPKLNVLYVSVYAAKAMLDQHVLEPGMPFMRKPLEAAAFGATLPHLIAVNPNS